jgi:hypothetical protein
MLEGLKPAANGRLAKLVYCPETLKIVLGLY